MTKFKSIYKNEYNKIIEDSNKGKSGLSNRYNFVTKVSSRFNLGQSTFSSRTRNKNDRFLLSP